MRKKIFILALAGSALMVVGGLNWLSQNIRISAKTRWTVDTAVYALKQKITFIPTQWWPWPHYIVVVDNVRESNQYGYFAYGIVQGVHPGKEEGESLRISVKLLSGDEIEYSITEESVFLVPTDIFTDSVLERSVTTGESVQLGYENQSSPVFVSIPFKPDYLHWSSYVYLSWFSSIPPSEYLDKKGKLKIVDKSIVPLRQIGYIGAVEEYFGY